MALNTTSPSSTRHHDRVAMVTHSLHPSTQCSNDELTPAAAFRNKYYLILSDPSPTALTAEQDDEDFICRPGAIVYAPLNTESTSFALSDQDDDDDKISIKTIESAHTTLFVPTSNLEPKITLQDQDKVNDNNSHTAPLASSSKLLSKFSKSTAPMRTRLSALSRSKTNLDYLWTSSSTTLTLPLRKSTESVHQMSVSGKRNRKNERSQSFSFNLPSPSAAVTTISNSIYPALLSKIAHAFKENVVVGTQTRDNIKYHDVFVGREAVNILASILQTSDRNLATLVGRALNDQKFFHDVNYERRLRDSEHELYQFREHKLVVNPSIKRKLSADSDTMVKSDENDQDDNMPHGVFTLLTNCYSSTCTFENSCYSVLCPRRFNKGQNSLFEENEDKLWIKTVPKSLSNSLSSTEKRRQENIFELIYTEKDFVEDLLYVEKNWIKPLLSSDCIPVEKRDEFVNALFWNLPEIREKNSLLLTDLLQRQLEHDIVHKIGDVFLKHVSNLFEHFIEYGSHQIIGKYMLETEKSTNATFAKFVEITERAPASRKLELNGYLTKPTTRLGRYNLLLTEILKNTPENHPDCETIPKAIKQIQQFLQRVNEESGKTENRFGLQILEQKLAFNKKNSYTQEIDDLDLLSEDRKIIFKGPLKRKSTTSNAASESSELQVYVLDHCLLLIKSKFLDNTEVFKLYKKPIPLAMLAIALPNQTRRSSSLLPYNRLSTGSFYSAGGSSDLSPSPLPSNSSSSAGNNTIGKSGYPISFIHMGRQGSGTITLYASTLASRRKWADTIERHRNSIMETSKVFKMTGISDQFFSTFNKVQCASAYASYIIFGCDHGIYLKKPVTHPIDDDDDDDQDDADKEGIVKILSLEKVSQIDILPGVRLMLILADKTLYTYSLDALFDQDNNILVDASIIASPSVSSPSSCMMKSIREHHSSVSSNSTESRATNNSSSSKSSKSSNMSSRVKKSEKATQHMRKIGNNVSFFKVGQVVDRSTATKHVERTLVCFVKYNAMTSTIRALEPCDERGSNNKKKKNRRSGSNKASLNLFKRPSNETLRVFKDLYIPGEATSFQYFKNVICVGSAKGFQMVDIGSAGVQSVLDPSDESHNFIGQRETLRPVSMFKHPDGCIMLCYNEIAFYIDKKGRRIRPDWIINWEGHPTAFAFRYPYILAFDSDFIEIRHVNTGDLTQVIAGHNIRSLRLEPTDVIYFVMEDKRTGNEMIFSLEK